MERLWKIMFDLVIIMSVGVYSVWGVPLRKIGFVKTNKNLLFKNSKAYPSWKKSYRCHATFFNSDKLLNCLKGHLFDKGFCHFWFVFVSCVCLSVTLCSLCLLVFLPPLLEVQCPNFLDIWNPWKKVMERSGLRYEPTS